MFVTPLAILSLSVSLFFSNSRIILDKKVLQNHKMIERVDWQKFMSKSMMNKIRFC